MNGLPFSVGVAPGTRMAVAMLAAVRHAIGFSVCVRFDGCQPIDGSPSAVHCEFARASLRPGSERPGEPKRLRYAHDRELVSGVPCE